MPKKVFHIQPNDYELAEKLAKLFKRYPVLGWDEFEVHWDDYEDKAAINLPILLKICELVGCTPEELYWTPDLDTTGCYYPGDHPELGFRFEVRAL